MKAETGDLIVLLHGIGHSRWNMVAVERSMRRAGFTVLNLTYPSRRRTIDALTAFLHEQFTKKNIWNGTGRVHFLTHSMRGG